MKRQPRAKLGAGGYAPSMKGKDPRGERMQPVVAEDAIKTRALQQLGQLSPDADATEVRTMLNEVVRILRGEETR